MTVAVFITNESDAACLIPWGVRFAASDHTDMLIVCPRKSKGKRGWDPLSASEKDDNALFRSVFDVLETQNPEQVVLKEAIAEGAESTDHDRVVVDMRELIATAPEDAFVEEIHGLDVRLILLPSFEPVKRGNENDMQWHQKLYRNAPCEVAVVKGLPTDAQEPMKVLVACQGETNPDSILSLERGCQIAKSSGSPNVSLLYVRPDNDLVASHIAEAHLRQLIKSVSERVVEIETSKILADSLSEGIKRLPLSTFDLVLVGTRSLKTMATLFRELESKDDEPSVPIVTIRAAVPLTVRIWDGFKTWVRCKVPQLDREHRVSLVDRLESSSLFNFDFTALISLSTLIAALGLARNSGAVVIGAMLVAPLMTPLVAIGFALVQGNEKLIRSALKSVVLGFAVALAIGATIGLILHVMVPSFEISPQMKDRGFPNMLDLVVALASGVAAAYAMGRPNLISALPGVAIAAALVPPVATSGLALTMGDVRLSGGASLLFFTNIVAIVLGTAITFWCVGISSRVSNDRSQRVWPRYLFLGFVLISFLLAAWMSFYNPLVHSSDDAQKYGKPGNGSNSQALIDLE